MDIKIKNYCFSPTLLPSIIVLFLFPLLLTLGLWQINRGATKNRIQMQFSQRSQSIPIDLNSLNSIDLEKNYFPGIMKGHFANQHSYLLDNKIKLHKIGYEVFTPFILKGSQKIILVNRGWIPQGLNRKEIPKIPILENEIIIQGLIIFPTTSFSFKQKSENSWPKRIQTINSHFLKKNQLEPFILVIDKKQPYSFIPLWRPVSLQASRHYAYAFQWLVLGLTLFIAYFSTHTRRL